MNVMLTPMIMIKKHNNDDECNGYTNDYEQ